MNEINCKLAGSKQRIIILIVLSALLLTNTKSFGNHALSFKEAQFMYSTQKEEDFNIIWQNNRTTSLSKMVFAFIYTADTPHGKIFISVELISISYFNTSKDNPTIWLRTRFYSQERVKPEDLYLYIVSGLRERVFDNDIIDIKNLPAYYGQPKKVIFRNKTSTINNIKAFQTCFEFAVCSYKSLSDYSINIFYNENEYAIFIDDKAIKAVIDVFLSAINKNWEDWENLSRIFNKR